jgi:hypothetical protein
MNNPGFRAGDQNVAQGAAERSHGETAIIAKLPARRISAGDTGDVSLLSASCFGANENKSNGARLITLDPPEMRRTSLYNKIARP